MVFEAISLRLISDRWRIARQRRVDDVANRLQLLGAAIVSAPGNNPFRPYAGGRWCRVRLQSAKWIRYSWRRSTDGKEVESQRFNGKLHHSGDFTGSVCRWWPRPASRRVRAAWRIYLAVVWFATHLHSQTGMRVLGRSWNHQHDP